MTTAVTQAEFARTIGVARSYVTALKKADRLVLNAIGNVLVEESKKRIAETADPNRDDVSARHAVARGDSSDNPENEQKTEDETPGGHDYHKSRAQKEHYFAEQARIDYERAIGKLLPESEVSYSQEDAMSVFRQSIENMAQRLPAEIVGKDLETIRITIRQESFSLLTELHKAFEKWKKQYLSSI